MKSIISFLLLLISIFVNAQQESIDKFLEKQIKEQRNVGLSIGIIKDNTFKYIE